MARHSSSTLFDTRREIDYLLELWPHKKNRPDRHTYTMIFPPPNVTGTLHLGHALTVSVQVYSILGRASKVII